LLELRTDDGSRIAAARDVAAGAVVLGDRAATPVPLLIDRIA
jgi:thymidine phosphorylase